MAWGESPLTGSRLSVGTPPSPIIIVFAHHNVPAVQTVRTSVGEYVAGFDLSVLGQKRNQHGRTAAFHTDDLFGWFHPTATGAVSSDRATWSVDLPIRKITTPMTPARIDPAKMPTLA